MRIRILDLDHSITSQNHLLQTLSPEVVPLADWGEKIRLACRHARFRRFEEALGDRLGHEDAESWLTFLGSGDFHHVSLALVRRIRQPFNLLVIDKHPDWVQRIPFLHCGTWLWHAACLGRVQRIYHVGGDLDFDNAFRLLAPWQELRTGRIVVWPATRRYRTGAWPHIRHEPLRSHPEEPVRRDGIESLIDPYRSQLAEYPLYISLDKDALSKEHAVVNWDSGALHTEEALGVMAAFLSAAEGQLAGMDILGDWSPFSGQGFFRRWLHRLEHPPLQIDAGQARQTNEATNLRLVQEIGEIGVSSFFPSAEIGVSSFFPSEEARKKN